MLQAAEKISSRPARFLSKKVFSHRTRTASISGGYVALHQAMLQLVKAGLIPKVPLNSAVAALSVGLIDGQPLLDLAYDEDVRAQVDFNLAMTDRGELVEIQGTAEGAPFSSEIVPQWIELASKGMGTIFQAQQDAIQSA